MAISADDITFEPGSPAFARDPYGVYAELRSLDKPWYYREIDGWLLSRYEDVEAAARDSRLVRSLDNLLSADEIEEQRRAANWHDMPDHYRFVQRSMLEQDGEMHDRLRLIILREFSRRFVEQQHAMIQAHVDRLLDRALALQDIDFVSDLAVQIPGHVIGSLIGVPDTDCPMLRTWSENIVQYFDVDRTDARKQLAESTTTEFFLYLQDLIRQREKSPEDDLLTRLVQARNQRELDDNELVSTCMLILMAGHGSTIDVLGSGLHTLLRFPGQMQLLRENPNLMPDAVQEMFRFESPLPFFHRYLSEDLRIAGREFPRGTKVGLLYGAANRDPKAFPDADNFDIRRQPNRHVAFGRGAHLCLGNHLARLDMDIIFRTLFSRTREIQLSDEPVYRPGLSVRGPQTLPVRLIAR